MIIIQDYNLNKLKDFKRLMKHELDEDYYETFLSHLESLQSQIAELKSELEREKKVVDFYACANGLRARQRQRERK